MDQLLNYGVLGKELIHISKVKNGLGCNCNCPNCKHPLVAKNNIQNKKTPHFAHYSGKECEGAIETALHLLAKSILYKTKQLRIPDYHYDYDIYNGRSIMSKGKEIIFDDIILENKIEINGEFIIPDAIGTYKGKQVFIEFANTHFVDEEKIQKIRKSNIACIEINLKDQLLCEKAIKSFFITDDVNKYWIINQNMDNNYQRSLEELAQQELKRIENENRIKLANHMRYKNDKNIKLLLVKDGDVLDCPKVQNPLYYKKIVLKKLAKTSFHTHPILKRIIDGEFWNGEIYGRGSNGKYIFLKGKKVYVYLPDLPLQNQTEIELKNPDLFFAGLKQMKETIFNSQMGNCHFCEFSGEKYSINDNGHKEFRVCKYIFFEG